MLCWKFFYYYYYVLVVSQHTKKKAKSQHIEMKQEGKKESSALAELSGLLQQNLNKVESARMCYQKKRKKDDKKKK